MVAVRSHTPSCSSLCQALMLQKGPHSTHLLLALCFSPCLPWLSPPGKLQSSVPFQDNKGPTEIPNQMLLGFSEFLSFLALIPDPAEIFFNLASAPAGFPYCLPSPRTLAASFEDLPAPCRTTQGMPTGTYSSPSGFFFLQKSPTFSAVFPLTKISCVEAVLHSWGQLL